MGKSFFNQANLLLFPLGDEQCDETAILNM